MKKKIIQIDEDLCVGCGNCVTTCVEGALQIINGKAKLVKEDFCDGIGNCIGDCPTGALKIVEKEISSVSKCNCPSLQAHKTGGPEVRQWPLQLHLVNPSASCFQNSALVVLSTCSPVASDKIHSRYIKDNQVVIACPKLDRTEGYVEKLSEIFRTANTPRVKVIIMDVPCCKGLSSIVTEAAKLSGRDDILLEEHTVSLDGNVCDIKEIKY
ncbi:MAG: 4Fe-4S binding protein [bacterium]